MTLDEALAAFPVVAILRGVTPDEAVAHVEALYAAGLRAVEAPLNSPQALDSIARLAAAFAGRMAVGAGTVLTPQQADEVAAAGGTFAVAPNVEPAVIRRCRELGLEPAPGFATASEAFTAIAAGARRLKLFPAATYGPAHLRQLKAVLPADVQVWAVGGVGPADFAPWRAAGAAAFGLGGELYRAGQTAAETAAKAAVVAAAVAAP
jgi:2-dehydro-3-deoxyphosphogalactonate aldolase